MSVEPEAPPAAVPAPAPAPASTPRQWWRLQWHWVPTDPYEHVEPEADAPPGTRPPQLRYLSSVRLALGWLVCLATLAALYVAKALVVPILIAGIIALSLNPLVNSFSRRWLPRSVVAALVMLGGLSLVALLVAWVADPAQHWIERAPTAVRSIAPKLRGMSQQIEAAGRATESLMTLGTQPAAAPNAPAGASPKLFDIWDAVSATPRLLGSIFAVILLGYFFLVYGDSLLRKTMYLAPSDRHKRRAVEIVRTMQREMSRYLFTTTVINSCVGVAAATIAFSRGIEDALLWGVLAAVLNFIPYIGPLSMTVVFALLGLLTFDKLGRALTPAAMYAGVVLIEGQFLTPWILGRRMQLNPVVILLWLMLLGWLWGVVGIMLAVPVLAGIKIVCERSENWNWVARAIE